MLTVKRENPTFTAVVKKEGRDGIKVIVDKDIMAFSGEKSYLSRTRNRSAAAIQTTRSA